eukprot:gene1086-1442_t
MFGLNSVGLTVGRTSGNLLGRSDVGTVDGDLVVGAKAFELETLMVPQAELHWVTQSERMTERRVDLTGLTWAVRDEQKALQWDQTVP